MTIEPATTTAQLAAIAALAPEIWREHYAPTVGLAQVDYMLARFQSLPAMTAQIAAGYEYFSVVAAAADRALVGYLAVQPQPESGRLFLSKFYLERSARGSGHGRRCLAFIEELGRDRGLTTLWLTVYKHNPSVAVYQRLGFHITGPIVIDIGDGYVMDDYRMEKSLP